jgi:hypothetical protein
MKNWKTTKKMKTIDFTYEKRQLARSLEFQTGEHMATLESITRGAAVRGILPEGLVTISDVRWIGTVAIEVTYKDSAGRLGNELLYRDREPTIEIVEAGRPWSFDGDNALIRVGAGHDRSWSTTK